jgi:hypothetical protein
MGMKEGEIGVGVGAGVGVGVEVRAGRMGSGMCQGRLRGLGVGVGLCLLEKGTFRGALHGHGLHRHIVLEVEVFLLIGCQLMNDTSPPLTLRDSPIKNTVHPRKEAPFVVTQSKDYEFIDYHAM